MSGPIVNISAVAHQIGADGMELRERPHGLGALLRLWVPDSAGVEILRRAVPRAWDFNSLEHLEQIDSTKTGPGYQVTIGIPQVAVNEARDALPAAQHALETGDDIPLVPEIVATDIVPDSTHDPVAWQRLDLLPGQILAAALDKLSCVALEARARSDTATRTTTGYRLVFSAPDDATALVAASLVEALGGSLEPGRPHLALGMRLPDLPIVAAWLPAHFGAFPI